MTDTAELIERLRNNNWSGNVTDDITRWADSRSEAADELQRLLDEQDVAYRRGIEDAAKVAETADIILAAISAEHARRLIAQAIRSAL